MQIKDQAQKNSLQTPQATNVNKEIIVTDTKKQDSCSVDDQTAFDYVTKVQF